MQTDSSTPPLYIAIDIGKNVHCYAAYSGPYLKVVQAPTEILSNHSGYTTFRHWLAEQIQAAPQRPVVLGLEPTGIYHESWRTALLRDFGQQIELREINPFQVSRKRAQLTNGRKKKTDPQDDLAIAHCLRDGLGHPARPPHLPSLRFQLWATSLRQTQLALGRLTRQLLSQIDRLWPGALLDVDKFKKAHPHLSAPEPLVRSSPLERKLVQLLLAFAPNPLDWQDWDGAQIQAFFRSHALACGPKKMAHFEQVRANLLLPDPTVAALLADQLHSDFCYYQQLAERYAHLEQQAHQLVPDSPAAVLTTFGQMGPFLAAQYVAWVGDPHRFQHADQIWSMAGLDLVQDDSGDRRRVGGITKRGAGAFRNVLFRIGLITSQHCPQLQATKQRALQRGLRPIGAILHVAHRANRICFRLLSDQVPFDPTKLP
jgi:transposase